MISTFRTSDFQISGSAISSHKNIQFSQPMTVHASKWYKIAAEKGLPNGMYELGMCYRWGEGGEYAEGEKAVHWFREAARGGHKEAQKLIDQFDSDSGMEMLSLSALHGAGGEFCYWYRSKMLVEGYYQQADEGNAEAQYELGRQLVPGTAYSAFKRDTKKAIKYYEMAAENGVIDAMFNLSNLYKEGNIGLEPDLVLSFEWMKKCMQAGDVEAKFEVGKRLIEGVGTDVNIVLGRKYVNEAADCGERRAIKYQKNHFEKAMDDYDGVIDILNNAEENESNCITENSDLGLEENNGISTQMILNVSSEEKQFETRQRPEEEMGTDINVEIGKMSVNGAVDRVVSEGVEYQEGDFENTCDDYEDLNDIPDDIQEAGSSNFDLEEINVSYAQMALNIAADEKLSLDKRICMVKELYDNVQNDYFLYAKRRDEFILYRLFELKFFNIEGRIGEKIDSGKFCGYTNESEKYREEIYEKEKQCFNKEKAEEIFNRGFEYYHADEFNKASLSFKESAVMGNANGALLCGDIMVKDSKSEIEGLEGTFWLWKSVLMGNPEGMVSLGAEYYKGDIVYKSKVRALYCFAYAASYYLKNGIHNVGILLSNGQVIPNQEDMGRLFLRAEADVDFSAMARKFIDNNAKVITELTQEELMKTEGGLW